MLPQPPPLLLLPLLSNSKNFAISQVLAELLGVLQEALGEKHRRGRGVRVRAPHEICVTPEDRRLQISGVHEMVGNHQELLSRHPLAVSGDHGGQFGDGARFGIAGEDQVEDGHEVALAAAETPVEIRRLARAAPGAPLQGPLYQIESLVEALHQLRGHLIVPDRARRVRDALAQAQDEVSTTDMVGDVDEVFDQSHRCKKGQLQC